jgi:hypothetical protein
MGTTTSPDGLYKPTVSETGWGALVNANMDAIQTRLNQVAPVGAFAMDYSASTSSAPAIWNMRARGAAPQKPLVRIMPTGSFTGDKAELTLMGTDVDDTNRWWADIKTAEESSTLRRWHFLTDRNGTAEPITRVCFEIDGEAESTVSEEFSIVRNGWIGNTEGGSGSGVFMLRVVGGSGITRIENNTIQLTTGNLVIGTDSGDIVPHPTGDIRPWADNDMSLGQASFRWQEGHYAGRLYYGVPNSAPTDGNIGVATVTAYLDEAGNNLKFRVKYANGTTLKTGTVALV